MPSNIIPNISWSNQPSCPVVLPPPENPNIKPPLPPLPPSPPKPATPPPPPEQPPMPMPPVEEELICEQLDTNPMDQNAKAIYEDDQLERKESVDMDISHEDVDMDIDTDEEKPLDLPEFKEKDCAEDKTDEKKISPWKNQVAQFEDLQLSDVTVSSVHTSDISLTSSDEGKNIEKTTPEQKKEKKKRKKQENITERLNRPRRKRIVNRKYASKDFSSFYNDIDNSDSDGDHKVSSTSNRDRDKSHGKQSPYSSSTPSPYYVASEEQVEIPPKKMERAKIQDPDTIREEKKTREPSPTPKGSSKRYDSSDLYKPRTSLRRSRRQSSPKFDDTDVYAPYRSSDRAKSNNKVRTRRPSSKTESKKSDINTPDSPITNEPSEPSTLKSRLGQRSSGVPTDPRKKVKEKVYESVSEGELIDEQKDAQKEKKPKKTKKPQRRKSEEEEGEITDGSLSSISLDPI